MKALAAINAELDAALDAYTASRMEVNAELDAAVLTLWDEDDTTAQGDTSQAATAVRHRAIQR